jgi:hypothetical protein
MEVNMKQFLIAFILCAFSTLGFSQNADSPKNLKECLAGASKVLGPVDEFIVDLASKNSSEEMDYKNGVTAGTAVGTFHSIEAALNSYCHLLFKK